MDIDFVFKIGAIGIVITVVSQVLSHAGREDVATLASLAGLIVVLLMVVNMVSSFFQDVRLMFDLK